jgi:RHS repeat-associated protein
MTDHAGRVHEHVEYYPYGEVWRDSRLDDDPGPQARTPAYLFTSKEFDPETKLYYFGARYYDARTSRWESTDPVLAKYLGGTGQNSIHQPKTLSLFSYAQFNPVHLIDPDGREPNRSQATTAAGVRAIIEQHFASGAVSLQSLRYTEGAKGGGKQVGPFGGGKGGRYVWTTQRGWIDLGHFFQVAAEAQKELGNGWKKGIAGGIGRAYTEHKLWEMTKKVENSQHGETRWSYEDPSSNKAGLDFFLDYYHGDKTLLGDLDRFFKDAGAANPRGAPNWKVMQKDQQEQHWFEPTDSIDPVLNPKRVDAKHPPPERTVD